ncbi:hypothetical protein NEF87_001492 [Candidatus Lokiarchaeum ossiferum]|uniref:PNPLA domain-containing protein n=1 Tax=Candidatus Lokiarchaeum ossiferum TaxID=2951803 RepID=A0ABY6HQP3_9ARCH|nr:hypothetical protein NEF87_001492 [Candidatus Lokiarchaeum sp. B-35]
MKRVLVLKGGGVRGLIQLDGLRVLEKYYGKKICEIFDLIVGTSVGALTGGILATGKYTMNQFMDIFIKYIPFLFKTFWWRKMFGALYSRKYFYAMWDRLFDYAVHMRDCKTRFLCTAVNICDFKTHFFKSWEKKDGKEKLQFQIAKSFAAPHYFGHLVDYKNQSVWVDGGMGESNTPIDIAFAEIFDLGWTQEHVEMTVIGTGSCDLSIPFEHAKKDGQIMQLYRFMQPKEGGLARIQSTINKVSRMEIIANSNPLFDFKYYNVDIGPEFDGIDKLRYINEYLAFGRVIGEKIQRDLNIFH